MRKGLSDMHYSILRWKQYDVFLAATEVGLCFVSTGTEGMEQLQAWQKKHFPERTLLKDDVKMAPYLVDLKHYLEGKTNSFSSSVHLCGTPFQQQVWEELQRIPYGEVRTYTDIANYINRPEAVRAVANAIGKNPILFIVPCHRVIRKDGNLSGFRAGVDVKRELLRLENIDLKETAQ